MLSVVLIGASVLNDVAGGSVGDSVEVTTEDGKLVDLVTDTDVVVASVDCVVLTALVDGDVFVRRMVVDCTEVVGLSPDEEDTPLEIELVAACV